MKYTHATSLRRFFARHQLGDRLAGLKLARARVWDEDISEPLFLVPAETTLAEKASEFLNGFDFRPDHFRAVSNWLLEVHDDQIRRNQSQAKCKRLALQGERHWFLAAVREANSCTSIQNGLHSEAELEELS